MKIGLTFRTFLVYDEFYRFSNKYLTHECKMSEIRIICITVVACVVCCHVTCEAGAAEREAESCPLLRSQRQPGPGQVSQSPVSE